MCLKENQPSTAMLIWRVWVRLPAAMIQFPLVMISVIADALQSLVCYLAGRIAFEGREAAWKDAQRVRLTDPNYLRFKREPSAETLRAFIEGCGVNWVMKNVGTLTNEVNEVKEGSARHREA